MAVRSSALVASERSIRESILTASEGSGAVSKVRGVERDAFCILCLFFSFECV